MLRFALWATILLCCGVGEASKCDKKMTGTSGEFQSPNYPYRYPVSTKCNYVIKAPPNHYVEITFRYFSLEPMYDGFMTDHLKIMDGRSKNRMQEKYLYGRISTPFKFTSITSRVIMEFVSNHEFNFKGFKAEYKTFPHVACDPLEIEHGKMDCDVNTETKKTFSCDVSSCDVGYHLHGNEKVKCINGSFVSPPRCLPLCQPLSVKYGKTECDVIPDTPKVRTCNVTCRDNYQLEGNSSSTCFNGSFISSSKCSPIPKVMERCSTNFTSCPYKAFEVAEFLVENEPEESGKPSEEEVVAVLEQVDANMTSRIAPGRSGGAPVREFICDKGLCRAGDRYNRKFLIRCYFYFNLPFFKKMPEEKKRNKITACYHCQKYSCRQPIPHQWIS